MALIADDAVVLRKFEYSETSQIAVFFTRRHGKVRAIAKGIKRSAKNRFAPGMDLCDIGRLVISAQAERSMALCTVTEWKQTKGLTELRKRLDRLYGAQYCLEIAYELTEEWDADAQLYDSVVFALGRVAVEADILPPIVRFQRDLLDAIGSMPRFDECVRGCGRNSKLASFSSTEGGVLCDSCGVGVREKHPITAPTLRAVRNPNEVHAGTGPFRVLDYHLSHLMGRSTRLGKKLIDASAKCR